ncbi:NAD-dependent epimerase/dehydratase family protein [Lacinutrix cladophorae]
MKILITGVSGFVGKNVFKHLSATHEVYGVSRTDLGYKNCQTLDFLNTLDVQQYFKENQFDVIVNLVSRMASVETAKDITLFTDNLKIQTNIIKALENYNKCTFINFSSSAVYPNIDGEFLEGSTIDPSFNSDCLYGLAKFNSEILFKFLFNENIKLVNLRVGYVHGEGMNNTRIHKVFEKELEESNTISVYGNGERIIPQISITSLVNTVSSFIESSIEGVYNVADENISVYDIAKNIIKIKGNSSSEIIRVDKGNTTKFQLNLDKINSI